MPLNVRLFWWISVVVVIYWLLATGWFFAFPSAHYLETLAKLPAEVRRGTQHVEAIARITSTIAWCGLTIVLAWLAAYRRLNWARWAFAVVFAVRGVASIVMGNIYDRQFHYLFERGSHEFWVVLPSYAVTLLTVIAAVLAFSGNAKAWFKERVGAS